MRKLLLCLLVGAAALSTHLTARSQNAAFSASEAGRSHARLQADKRTAGIPIPTINASTCAAQGDPAAGRNQTLGGNGLCADPATITRQ